ncbi:MAG: glycosyltransferase family A protein [Myxococcota bacterium]
MTVLMPVWNAERTLETALRSVQRQTETDFECVVVDDGSIDRSASIAADFARADRRFRVLDRPHKGIVASLEAGLDAARSPLVARLDADDWMRRDRLAKQASLLAADPTLQAVGGGVRIFPRKGLRDGRRAYERWLNALDSPARIWRERFIECPVAHPALMIRHERLTALRYRDRGWPEDYDLLLRLLRDGPVVGAVPERILGWRDLPTRLSRTDPRCSQGRFTACRAWHLSRDFLADAPAYLLWGHGATGKALRRELEALGHLPNAIVEVHPGRLGNEIAGAPVVPIDVLERRPPYPLVVSVAGSTPRGEIRARLATYGFREGIDYVCAA